MIDSNNPLLVGFFVQILWIPDCNDSLPGPVGKLAKVGKLRISLLVQRRMLHLHSQVESSDFRRVGNPVRRYLR